MGFELIYHYWIALVLVNVFFFSISWDYILSMVFLAYPFQNFLCFIWYVVYSHLMIVCVVMFILMSLTRSILFNYCIIYLAYLLIVLCYSIFVSTKISCKQLYKMHRLWYEFTQILHSEWIQCFLYNSRKTNQRPFQFVAFSLSGEVIEY